LAKKTSQLAKRSYSIGKKNSFILIGKKKPLNWQKDLIQLAKKTTP
jgi:hypothetical protein